MKIIRIKNYVVSTHFSSMQIQARNKKEALAIFKQQMKGTLSKFDRITIK